ncbi:hypothetical protein N9C08_00545 [Rubripirellula sp.]|nr:hypothetical protein [Rubripirellula sp.]
MNVVFLHCHYERGGVTTVVLNQLKSLVSDPSVHNVVLVSGARTSGIPEDLPADVNRLELESLDYDSGVIEASNHQDRISSIVADLSGLFRKAGLRQNNTVLHWHNHSLGKNVSLPGVATQLALKGWRTLLQIHDFAEDYRPSNYSAIVHALGESTQSSVDRYLYPIAPQIHYGALTQTDAELLRQIGIPSERVYFLPNGMEAADRSPRWTPEQHQESLERIRRVFKLPVKARWSVYPVRGIRRKNLGEFLLLSQFCSENRYCAITLSPTTSIEKKSYERWRGVAEKYAPRAIFDAGHRDDVTFQDNLLASDFVLSTSVAEGFGMAFLEPWLFGRRVVARRLDNVVPDFESLGLNLSSFYSSIMIPGDPSWVEACRNELHAAFNMAWDSLFESKNLKVSHHQFLGPIEKCHDAIDFALLSPSRQIDVLQRFFSDKGFRLAVQKYSSELIQMLGEIGCEDVINQNVKIVNQEFSSRAVRERLLNSYRNILSSEVASPESWPDKRLQGALDLLTSRRPFYPCRTEE